jgi:hypothetical protein
MDRRRTAKVTPPLFRYSGLQMACTGMTVLYVPVGGQTKTLLGTFVRLLLGHSAASLRGSWISVLETPESNCCRPGVKGGLGKIGYDKWATSCQTAGTNRRWQRRMLDFRIEPLDPPRRRVDRGRSATVSVDRLARGPATGTGPTFCEWAMPFRSPRSGIRRASGR